MSRTMTKQEAIEYGLRWKNAIIDRGDTENSEAIQFLNIAIQALQQRPIIHCKDCKFNTGKSKCFNPNSAMLFPDDDDFCSYAERMESDE